jgi:hypothetical protein
MVAPNWLIDVLKAKPAPAPQPTTAQPLRPPVKNGQSVIDLYNEHTNIRTLLQAYGYTMVDDNHFVRPGKDPRAGVSGTIDSAANSCFTFSSNDPAYNAGNLSPSGAGCTLKPFDLLCRVSFGGDARAAVKYLHQAVTA